MIQRYKILEQLGGSGVIYKAYDTQLNRYVAIKRLMSHEEASSEEKISDIKLGVSLLTTLQHPCIATIFDSGSDDVGFFMVMELVAWGNLKDLINNEAIGLQDFEVLSHQCMEAIITAHQRGILHLDLKPENIKVARLQDGKLHVKLVDFSLPYPTFSTDQKGASVHYLAPEQLRHEFLDARTDLYALGCIFYLTLSKRLPFDHDTTEGVIQAHLQHCVYPLREVAPMLPQPLCDWVMWLTNFNAAHRPANAEQAMSSLMEISAAGWFKEMSTVSMQQAAAQPRFVYATARPPTGRISSSGVPIRPPTGRVPQHMATSLPQYPGMMMRPVTAPRKHAVPVWVYVAAASVIVLGVAALLIFKGGGTGAAGVVARSDDFLKGGYLVQYRAGVGMNGQISSGAVVNRGVTVNNWQSDGGIMHGLSLTTVSSGSGPAYLVERPENFRRETAFLRFERGQALFAHTDINNALSKEYPFGSYSKVKGVTIMLLVRPLAVDSEALCLRLRNQEGKCFVDIRAMPKTGFRLKIKAGDEFKEIKVSNRLTTEFNLIGISWNNATGKATFAVRGQNGDLERAEATFTGNLETAPLNEIYIGASGESKIDTNDQFAGDIAELAIWPFPMEWEDRSGQEMRFMESYFKNTGTQY